MRFMSLSRKSQPARPKLAFVIPMGVYTRCVIGRYYSYILIRLGRLGRLGSSSGNGWPYHWPNVEGGGDESEWGGKIRVGLHEPTPPTPYVSTRAPMAGAALGMGWWLPYAGCVQARVIAEAAIAPVDIVDGCAMNRGQQVELCHGNCAQNRPDLCIETGRGSPDMLAQRVASHGEGSPSRIRPKFSRESCTITH